MLFDMRSAKTTTGTFAFFFSAPGSDSCLFETHLGFWGQIRVFRCLPHHWIDTCVYLLNTVSYLQSHPFFLGPKCFSCPDEEVCPLCFFSQGKDGGPSEPSEVRVGKWKVPSSQNYLALYKSLLDCDQLKVHLSCFFVWFYIWHYVVFSYPASLLTTKLKPFPNTKSILDGYHCITAVKLIWI